MAETNLKAKAKARPDDALAALREAVAAGDIERVKGLIVDLASAAPGVRDAACRIVGDLDAEWEKWARDLFAAQEPKPRARSRLGLLPIGGGAARGRVSRPADLTAEPPANDEGAATIEEAKRTPGTDLQAAAPEPQAKPAGEPGSIDWKIVGWGDAPVLSRKAPLDNAKLFTRRKLEYSAEGHTSGPGSYYFQKQWWQWNGAFYERAPDQRLIDVAAQFMDEAVVQTGEGLARFKPTTRDLGSLMTFLQSNVGLDDRLMPPLWLDKRPAPAPEGLLAFRNCLVDVTNGRTYPHEPWLWIHDGVDFNYDPRAQCPRWEQFLREVFPRDEEAREVVEQQIGYGMTIDNQFEKAALWIGDKRSGRGTLAHIQALLVGGNGCCSLDFHAWHKGENSRQKMIGRRVGIFHDIRLRPPKQYGSAGFDLGGIDPHSQQLLLELISGDLTEIGRKYLEDWKGRPFIKFILISNKVPNFNDEVLITRFIALEFKESWLGKEDPALKLRVLPSELPGIANRCLAAYRRLLAQGRFIQPNCGLMLLSRVKAAVSPWSAFMDLYWDPDPLGEGVLVSRFAGLFRHWCLQTGTLELAGTSKSNMIQGINKIPKWAHLKSFRPAGAGGAPEPRRYRVKLKPGVVIAPEVLRGEYDD